MLLCFWDVSVGWHQGLLCQPLAYARLQWRAACISAPDVTLRLLWVVARSTRLFPWTGSGVKHFSSFLPLQCQDGLPRTGSPSLGLA